MNRKRQIYRNKMPSHQELIDDGYIERKKFKPKKAPPKGSINSIQWGSNGRMYIKVMKMNRIEKKIFADADKRKREGKEIMYSFQPNDLIMKLSVDVKKDRRGNITVNIKEAKKGYCHKWDCPKRSKKNYSLCPKHLREAKARSKARHR